MMQRSTPIPNMFFDSLISHFSESELKVFLVIMRKTLGWYDKETGGRKQRDWIALSQFEGFTGLSNVSIWKAIDSLSKRQYVRITDSEGGILSDARSRQGRKKLFYQLEPSLLKIFK